MKLRRDQVETLINLVEHSSKHPWKTFKMKDDEGNTIELDSELQNSVIHRTVQNYIHDSATILEEEIPERKSSATEKKTIQAFAGTPDLPVLTKDVFNVSTWAPEFDTYWQEAFRTVELMQGELSWEIGAASSPIVMDIVPEGGEAKIYKFEGVLTQAEVFLRGAGLGFTWQVMHNRKIMRFIDNMERVRAAYYKTWADAHYGLLATAAKTAVSGATGSTASQQVTWQNPTGNTQMRVVDRDIATIDAGYYAIGEAVKDKDYSSEVANTEMLLYASPRLRGRINNAIRQQMNPEAQSILNSMIRPIYTFTSKIDANTALLVLPGNKIQNAVYLQELGMSERKPLTLDTIYTYWTAFGAIVADSDQCALLNFA